MKAGPSSAGRPPAQAAARRSGPRAEGGVLAPAGTAADPSADAKAAAAPEPPFWRSKPLERMSRAEWESLCDGCGRCCLHKLRDEGTGRVRYTEVACRLLDLDACRCSDYPNRQARVPDCVRLTPARLARIDWLPPSCAYRLLREGKDLPEWHPLVSGDRESVHRAGASVRGRAVAESEAGRLEDHVVRWPALWPRGREKGKG